MRTGSSVHLPRYAHTQTGPVHLILYGLAAMFIYIAWSSDSGSLPYVGMVALAGLMIFFALCFQRLTVCDERDSLAIRYGPMPVFRRRIPYSSITGVEAARSDWLDGGGIHYIPGRGWIYNLWGRDCVRLQLKDKAVRIGTDDLEGLLCFLKTRVAEN